jgi:hypothetical protein
LGVAHNVGVELTYHMLTDDSQQVIQRSVIRSRKDPHGINKRVTFDPNLDPEVTLDANNQNVAYRTPIRFSDDEIPDIKESRFPMYEGLIRNQIPRTCGLQRWPLNIELS